MLVAITAVALGIAGAASSAQAGNDRDDDGDGQGGIKVGPLGQTFGAPPAGVFASAPPTVKQVRGKRASSGKRD